MSQRPEFVVDLAEVHEDDEVLYYERQDGTGFDLHGDLATRVDQLRAEHAEAMAEVHAGSDRRRAALDGRVITREVSEAFERAGLSWQHSRAAGSLFRSELRCQCLDAERVTVAGDFGEVDLDFAVASWLESAASAEPFRPTNFPRGGGELVGQLRALLRH